jgi:hypothetical protein
VAGHANHKRGQAQEDPRDSNGFNSLIFGEQFDLRRCANLAEVRDVELRLVRETDHVLWFIEIRSGRSILGPQDFDAIPTLLQREAGKRNDRRSPLIPAVDAVTCSGFPLMVRVYSRTICWASSRNAELTSASS